MRGHLWMKRSAAISRMWRKKSASGGFLDLKYVAVAESSLRRKYSSARAWALAVHRGHGETNGSGQCLVRRRLSFVRSTDAAVGYFEVQ